MITRDDWDRLSDDEKFDYLFRHTVATEQAAARLGGTMQLLHERLAKLEKKAAEESAS